MSRHLLPKNKGTLNIATTGQWVDFSADFSRFQDNIEIPDGARINVTSIPSPWARMLLFNEAVENNHHLLHSEVMSNILDVIELIYYEKMLSFRLEAKEIHLQKDQPQTRFHDILFKLYPGMGQNQTDITLTLLLAKQGNDTFVLAGSSNRSLFFTPLDLKLKNKIPRYFMDKPVRLDKRPEEFQRWFKQVFLPKLRSKGSYQTLVAAFELPDGFCSGCDNASPNNSDFESSELFNRHSNLFGLFDRAKTIQIDSPNLLNSELVKDRPPLVIDTSVNLIGRPFFNGYTYAEDYKPGALRTIDREVLPGQNMRYPWLLPQYDFLQPRIIRYRYKLNDEFLIMGAGSNEFKYLPPLTEEYFKYFTPREVDQYLSIIDDGPNSVKVRLEIPLQNGGIVSVEKRYSGAWGENRREDCIIEFDDKDINTPLPHLVFWPKLNPENWDRPYYCLIYGERYNSQNRELFALDFKKGITDPINHKISRKSKTVDLAELQTLPNYVAVRHKDSDTTGFLLLDHNKFPSYDLNVGKAKVGVDFGTSHTNIAIKTDGTTDVLKYSSKYGGPGLNSEDFISTMAFSDEQMKTDNIPILIKASLSQYLYPNRLGLGNSVDETSMPLPTMVIKTEDDQDPQPLLSYSVNFSKSKFFPYSEAARPVGLSMRQMIDLKWNHDVNNQEASEQYLRILMTLVFYELTKRRVNPKDASYSWAFPRSFSDTDIDKYTRMWKNVLGEISSEKTDESKAALMYFDHIKKVSAQTPGMVITADIGGGSSDVSVWRNSKILLLNSSLWAGRDLVGYKDVNGRYSVLYDTLNSQFQDIAKNYIGLDDYQTHLNYILYSVPAEKLANYVQSDRFYKVRFLILYFFSSLFYEIGLQSSRFVDNDLSSLDICLAGNGSRFACWSGIGDDISHLDASIYKAIIKEAMGLGPDVAINLETSKSKKWEVAVGLCEGRPELLAQEADNQPLTVESVSLGQDHLSGDLSIEELGSKLGRNVNQINLKKEGSELSRFHDLFFREMRKSDLYARELRHDKALADINKLKNELLGNWDTLVGQIRTSAGDNFNNFNTISSSLFILGMKAAIMRLHRHLAGKS